MATDEEEPKSLSTVALQRKERLKNLKRSKQDDKISENDTSEASLPRPVFRSYEPVDVSLKENVLDKAKPESVDEQIKDELESATPDALLEEVNLASLAPRKPDWDLKRDVSKKLEKLERKTQKAIIELIRERLLKVNETNESSTDTLADVVNVADRTENMDSDDD